LSSIPSDQLQYAEIPRMKNMLYFTARTLR
jgi:hypothetical protein